MRKYGAKSAKNFYIILYKKNKAASGPEKNMARQKVNDFTHSVNNIKNNCHIQLHI